MVTCSTAFTVIKSMVSNFFRQSLLNLNYKWCWASNSPFTKKCFRCLKSEQSWIATDVDRLKRNSVWWTKLWRAGMNCCVCYPTTASFAFPLCWVLSPFIITHVLSINTFIAEGANSTTQLTRIWTKHPSCSTILTSGPTNRWKWEVQSTPVEVYNYHDCIHSSAVTHIKGKHLPSSSHAALWFLVPSPI